MSSDLHCNYERFSGWQKDLNTTNYTQLPTELQNYVDYLEQYLKVPVSMVSTGPEREKLLIKQGVLV